MATKKKKKATQLWFKILNTAGAAIHGGHGTYILPKVVKGEWVPGQWMPAVRPSICYRGYHLTRKIHSWFGSNVCVIWVAEPRGRSQNEGDPDRKTAFEEVRLLRPATLREILDHGGNTESVLRNLSGHLALLRQTPAGTKSALRLREEVKRAARRTKLKEVKRTIRQQLVNAKYSLHSAEHDLKRALLQAASAKKRIAAKKARLKVVEAEAARKLRELRRG